MKKFCAILFSFVLVLMLALPVAAEDAAGESDSLFDTAPALTAPAGYVVNLDTNIVVYEKNSETQLSAASLTKMMTTLQAADEGRVSHRQSASGISRQVSPHPSAGGAAPTFPQGGRHSALWGGLPSPRRSCAIVSRCSSSINSFLSLLFSLQIWYTDR